MNKVPRLNSYLSAKQRGFSGACFLSMLLLIIVTLWFAFKVLPVYIEHKAVTGAMDRVLQFDDIHRLDGDEILNAIQRRLQVDNGWSRNEVDFHKIAYTYNRDGEQGVGLNYEVTLPIIYNLSLLIHFKRESMIALNTN